MASALLAQVEVVGRLLNALEGAELARVSLEQSRAISANLERVRSLSLAEKGDLVAGIGGLRLDAAEKARLISLVHGKHNGESRKRPMQDYVSWPSFCTPHIWKSIANNPMLAVEILCQHMNSLGLINASKDTQRSIAAHAATAELAQNPFPVTEANAQRAFTAVGKRLKQMYKTEPLEYIVKLPSTPAELLRSYPLTAKAAFSRENLPCLCPLDPRMVSDAAHKIQCRGGGDKQERQSPDMQHMMGFMMQFVSRMMSSSQQRGDCDVKWLQPGSLFQQASPARMKFDQLADRAVGAQKPDDGASMTATTKACAEVTPPCLQILDATAAEGDPPATPTKAIAMRETIMAARADIAADRAAASAMEKKKGKTQKKDVKKPLKATGTKEIKKEKKDVKKPKSWLKARPTGCAECRHIPGCTKSCYVQRGEKPPK